MTVFMASRRLVDTLSPGGAERLLLCRWFLTCTCTLYLYLVLVPCTCTLYLYSVLIRLHPVRFRIRTGAAVADGF
jgi:hypothetical protein